MLQTRRMSESKGHFMKMDHSVLPHPGTAAARLGPLQAGRRLLPREARPPAALPRVRPGKPRGLAGV